MNYLVIDTTKQNAVLVACVNSKCYTSVLPSTKKHSEYLLVSLQELLEKANISLAEFDAFGCVTGPGSFTGIRIGIATIKAFAQSLNKPVCEGNVFEIVQNYVENGTVLLTSTSTSFYYGNIVNKKLTDFGVISHEDVKNIATENAPVFMLSQEQISSNFSYTSIETIKNYEELLTKFFEEKVLAKQFIDLPKLQPFYIQLSQAERDLKKVVKK